MFTCIINQILILSRKFFFLIFLFFIIPADGQVPSPFSSFSSELTNKYLGKINKKVLSLDKSTTNRTEKSFKKFQRQQKRLHKKLCKINPELADKLFSYQADPLYYQDDAFNLPPRTKLKSGPQEYNPYWDTLKCSSSFFNKAQSDSGMLSSAAVTNKNVLDCDSKLEHANKIQH